MKEFMPSTHIDADATDAAFIARAYGARVLSFEDIARDGGAREVSTFDAITSLEFERRVRKMNGLRGEAL